MKWSHKRHFRESLYLAKIDGSRPVKKETKASCDPWYQFGLLLRLPTLKFLGMGLPVVAPGAEHRQQGISSKAPWPGRRSCCSSHAISPLLVVCSLHVFSPSLASLAICKTLRAIGLLLPESQHEVVQGSETQPLQAVREVSSCVGGGGGWDLCTPNAEQDRKQQTTHHWLSP